MQFFHSFVLFSAAVFTAQAQNGVPPQIPVPLNVHGVQPSITYTKGKYPLQPGCKSLQKADGIQGALCAFNRLTGREAETFATFKIDHSKDHWPGAPYGLCEAYTCDAPKSEELKQDADYYTFFWNKNGERTGQGFECVRDLNNVCGCVTQDRHFNVGKPWQWCQRQDRKSKGKSHHSVLAY